MNILVYIEAKEGKALPSSLELLGLGASLGTVSAAVLNDAQAAEQAAAFGTPVTLVRTQEQNQDAAVNALEGLIRETAPELVLFASSQDGKIYAPRLAQRFNAGCVTDAIGIENVDGILQYLRPAYGGTVQEKLVIKGDVPQFASVRGGTAEKPQPAAEPAAVTECAGAEGDIRARVTDVVTEMSESVDLEAADIIVTGGRGMGSAEGFKLVEELASLLGAVVGASRPAIEEGWTTRAHQVGQSGKIVAPKLYIACGVSGAMQHISGMMGSGYIVAINKDEEASIFDIADVGIVGDVKEVIPLLMEEIKARRG